MGRKIKNGFTYFPMDVDFYSDVKIRRLIKSKTANAISIYIDLLCRIYKNGYFLEYDDDLTFFISEDTGYDEKYISEVISECLNVKLFSSEMQLKYNVLTSRSIQERFENISKISKRLTIIKNYDLINSEEITINSEKTPIYSEEIPISSEETTINSEKGVQRKEDAKKSKSKVNKSKEKERKANEIFSDKSVRFDSVFGTEKLHA